VFDPWSKVPKEDSGNEGLRAKVKRNFDLFVDGVSYFETPSIKKRTNGGVVPLILENFGVKPQPVSPPHSMPYNPPQSPNSRRQPVDTPAPA